MINTIIFDFFGVFRTDPYKAWLLANNFDRKGAFAEASLLSDAGKITGDEFYRKISEAAGHLVTPEEFDASAKLDDDMVAFARHLKKTYRTCLLSNAPSDFVRGLLNDHGLSDIFDTIFISSETGFLKPSSEAFEDVLSTMNIKSYEAAFIDDNTMNVEGAEECGIKSIVFTSVDQLKKELNDLSIRC